MTTIKDLVDAQTRVIEPRNPIPCGTPLPPAPFHWRPCQYPERPIDGGASIGGDCPRCLIAYVAHLRQDPDKVWTVTGAGDGTRVRAESVSAARMVLKTSRVPADHPVRVLLARAIEEVEAR